MHTFFTLLLALLVVYYSPCGIRCVFYTGLVAYIISLLWNRFIWKANLIPERIVLLFGLVPYRDNNSHAAVNSGSLSDSRSGTRGGSTSGTASLPRPLPTLKEWIDEQPTQSSTQREIPCLNPGTGEPLCSPVPSMSAEEIELRTKRARIAQQRQWQYTTFQQRREVLKTILNDILDRKYELAAASSQDSGKTLVEAYLGEILASCEKLRWIIKYGEEHLQPETRHVPMLMLTKYAYVEYLPKGVIATIIPWNYPFHNIIGSLVAALFTGNAVVCKVSEWVAWSLIEHFESLYKRALMKHGYSTDLIQFILGYGDAGASLIKSPYIDHVFFIGSPHTGRLVMSAASENLRETTLELGGKDPFIITNDVDLDFIVDYSVRSIFINCGQNCVAAERFYCHRDIVKSFTDKVVSFTKTLRQGATVCRETGLSESEVFDCGAMTMTNQLNIIQELVDDAVNQGAKILCGGKKRETAKGQFYEPTILTNLKQSMRIVKEEVFGPVMLILSYDNDEQAIEMANDHNFGLGSYVFCRNAQRAQKIADKLVAGVSMVNDYGVFYMIQSLPFGGTKQSGFGKFNGKEGLRSFCYQKSMVRDRFPGLVVSVPKIIRYPTRAIGHELMGYAIDMIYRESFVASGQALVRFIRGMIEFSRSEDKKEK